MKLEPEAGAAVVGRDVGRAGATSKTSRDKVRALVVADDEIGHRPSVRERATKSAKIEPRSHSGTPGRNPLGANVLEQLALRLEREQEDVEPPPCETGQQDRPVSLGSADSRVLRDEERSHHAPRRRPAVNAGAVTS